MRVFTGYIGARVPTQAEVKRLRRLIYDIAQGPEPNPPVANSRLTCPDPNVALSAARKEVARLRQLGRRLVHNQSIIDHLRTEVAWDGEEDWETEDKLSVAQQVATEGEYKDLVANEVSALSDSFGVSTTKDPGGGWFGEALRADSILKRTADPEIEELQEKVIKRRADYAKAAKKLKKAKKKLPKI